MVEALRACGPDEGRLRSLVMSTLRRDRALLESIADGEPLDFDGSLRTLCDFIGDGRWPEGDAGWGREAADLTLHDYWMPGEEPGEFQRKLRGKGGRPDERTTLRCVTACVLLADLEMHAPFGGGEDEAGARTCLMLVDGSLRLGGDWPGALIAWVAAVALRETGAEGEGPSFGWAERVAPPLFALVLLTARDKALGGEAHPVPALVCFIERLGRDTWLVPTLSFLGRAEDPARVAEAVVEPMLDRLDTEDREAVARLLGKFAASGA